MTIRILVFFSTEMIYFSILRLLSDIHQVQQDHVQGPVSTEAGGRKNGEQPCQPGLGATGG